MKTKLKIMVLSTILIIGFLSCGKDEKANESIVVLEKTLYSGFTGDTIKMNVTAEGERIRKIIVTKWRSGVHESDYELNIPFSDLKDGYHFNQEIEIGDEEGVLVYLFSGYDDANEFIDASELVVSVTLTDLGRLLRYDWRLNEELTNGDDTMKEEKKDDVYRLNKDFSWEFDWGNPAGAGLDVLNQYCAWKYIGTELKADSIHFIKYGFLSTVPVIDKYEVLKLDDDNLWIQTFMDLSWLGEPYTEETPVIQKFIAAPKTSDFTPYRGENIEDYNWASCEPGTY